MRSPSLQAEFAMTLHLQPDDGSPPPAGLVLRVPPEAEAHSPNPGSSASAQSPVPGFASAPPDLRRLRLRKTGSPPDWHSTASTPHVLFCSAAAMRRDVLPASAR